MSDQTIIKEYGIYHVAQDGIDIVVRESPSGLLAYSVNDVNGVVLLHQGPDSISIYHRWALYWDSGHKCLWVYSGDRGSFVWRKGDAGQYEESALTVSDPNNWREMPDQLFREHPSSLQKMVTRYREKQDNMDK